jgi:hypothetical protein
MIQLNQDFLQGHKYIQTLSEIIAIQGKDCWGECTKLKVRHLDFNYNTCGMTGCGLISTVQTLNMSYTS